MENDKFNGEGDEKTADFGRKSDEKSTSIYPLLGAKVEQRHELHNEYEWRIEKNENNVPRQPRI